MRTGIFPSLPIIKRIPILMKHHYGICIMYMRIFCPTVQRELLSRASETQTGNSIKFLTAPGPKQQKPPPSQNVCMQI